MVMNSKATSAIFCFLSIVLLFVDTVRIHAQQLDDSWQVTVGGRTAQVNPDGSFRIDNVSAPDLFGVGGPNTPRDFLSDDLVRLTGFSRSSGVTRYVYSERFRIEQGETFEVENLIFSDDPPPVPIRLRMTAPRRNLNFIGDTLQVSVSAILGSGSTLDVTDGSDFTTYRTSNLDVADVNADGLVTAIGGGRAIITATNEGISTAIRVEVTPDAVLTSIVGILRNPDGTPLAGVTVSILGQAGTAITDGGGFFRIDNVLADAGELVLLITNGSDINTTLFVSSLAADGITDVGLVDVEVGDPGTTVQGFVQNEDGTPAVNAQVDLLEQGLTTFTDSSGFYQFDNVASDSGALSVRISLDDRLATVANVDPILES